MKFRKGEILLIIDQECSIDRPATKRISKFVVTSSCPHTIIMKYVYLILVDGKGTLTRRTTQNLANRKHPPPTELRPISHPFLWTNAMRQIPFTNQYQNKSANARPYSPFLHYPCSDCWVVVINLKSDEAGERERDCRKRDPIWRAGSKQGETSRARKQQAGTGVLTV